MLVPSGNCRDSESLIIETVEKARSMSVATRKIFVKSVRRFDASNKTFILNT